MLNTISIQVLEIFSFRKRKMINILIEHHKKSKYTHVVLKIKDYSFFYFYYFFGGDPCFGTMGEKRWVNLFYFLRTYGKIIGAL